MGVPRKVTMTYAEFDRFWNEVLGDSWCLEDDDLPDTFWEGDDPHRTGTITSGFIYWQADGKPEPTDWYTQRQIDQGLSFFSLVHRWRQQQTVTTAVAEIPKDRTADWLAFVASIGGKAITPTSPEI